MAAFDHLMTLGSLLVTLGIAAILLFVATLVQRRHDVAGHTPAVRLHAPQLMWAAATLLSLVSFWLGSYYFHILGRSSFVSLGLVAVFPILLFLQAMLVAPVPGGSLDLAAHHERNLGHYASIAAICALMQVGFFGWIDLVNPATPVPLALFALPAIQGLIAVAAALWRATWFQTVAAALQVLLGLASLYGSLWTLAASAGLPGL